MKTTSNARLRKLSANPEIVNARMVGIDRSSIKLAGSGPSESVSCDLGEDEALAQARASFRLLGRVCRYQSRIISVSFHHVVGTAFKLVPLQ